MTGQEMLREVETKARKEGIETGRKMVRLAFEQRFGPIPSSLDEALGHIQDLGELERIMAACLSKPKEEIACAPAQAKASSPCLDGGNSGGC
jgi:hypothetical protein